MSNTTPTEGLTLLRKPFPDNLVGKLPRAISKDDKDKGRCDGPRYSADGFYCGGWHAKSIHLDFVGHAALTDRLLDADPGWTWEPLALTQAGLPAFDANGGLWIKLTVCGVTRLGYGDAQGKTGPNAVKEAIGDALRNAGMRFGAALDLWHKGDLHGDQEDHTEPAARPVPAAEPEDGAPALLRRVAAQADRLGIPRAEVVERFAAQNEGLDIRSADAEALGAFLSGLLALAPASVNGAVS